MKLFNQTCYKENRKRLRIDDTSSEYLLWLHLKKEGVGVKFRRQYGVGPFIVDFCCPKKKLVIEVDGPIHNRLDIKKYDSERQKFIEGVGFLFLRFTNQEVLEKTDGVLEKIKNTLAKI